MTKVASPATSVALRPQHRLADPRILFPIVAAVLVTTAWTTAVLLIRAEHAAAREAAAASTVELAQTYEAQVVRALREINQTLGFIGYSFADAGASTLDALDARGLLPSALLFSFAIADANGRVVAANGMTRGDDVSDSSWFREAAAAAGLVASGPSRQPAGSEWLVHFSRPLETAAGEFAGVAVVSVDPVYFVSGYDAREMGEHGVLGVLRDDGTFLVRRTGGDVTYGERVAYRSVLAAGDGEAVGASVVTHPWDGVARYTVARELYGFPLAVVVGLAEEEQLLPARAALDGHILRASAASALALLVTGLLGRLSWKLQQARQSVVEEQVRHARQVEYLAYHDSLTGLANRGLFSKLLNVSIAQARRYERGLAVLFLDLDRFKLINDTLGHDAGDDLLRQVASRLRNSLRASDTVARLGGDEFVILLPETSGERQLTVVAQKILNAVRKPFPVAGQQLRITVSIGISLYPQDGPDEQTLMKNADIAMYNAKAEGKNNFRFYSETLNTNSLERLSLESSLRRALDQNEFRLFYQARKHIDTGQVTGVEALLRWQHPELGLLAPMQFLPQAEESGLIVQIGQWVLEAACRQAVAWRQQGVADLTMSVNLSAREFADENLLNSIVQILDRTGMEARRLEVEFAENLLARDVDKALPLIDGLAALGVRIAIDDFGAGYASLAALKQFRVSTVKLDHRFVRDIVNNPDEQQVVEAIIAMARTLGLTVVAEGVETEEQAAVLRRTSCDEIQGLLFNRPSPPERLIAELHLRRA